MKVYDLQWFTTYGMSPGQAAVALRDDGINTVLTQNFIDPLPGSGVDQSAYLTGTEQRLSEYRDQDWVNALHEAGLAVLQTTATFFDPAALEQFPDARPINALGVPDRGFDWYIGICPTHQGYLDWKIARLQRVIAELKPDGLFLQFTRFPGFWENWAWDPDYVFTEADQFCFCDRCRTLFAEEMDIALANGDIRHQAREILERHGEIWTDWRSQKLVEAIERIVGASGVRSRNLAVMLNTLPFPASDFGGIDVRKTIVAQHLPLLADVVDRFELMTYLQILNRPVSWIEPAIADARRQLADESEVVCTLQVAPLYTTGVHAERGRSPEVTAEELEAAGRTALDAGADGLVFYHWTDFLEDEAAGGRKRDVLRKLTGRKRGSQ
jgi:hypothetical protein